MGRVLQVIKNKREKGVLSLYSFACDIHRLRVHFYFFSYISLYYILVIFLNGKGSKSILKVFKII